MENEGVVKPVYTIEQAQLVVSALMRLANDDSALGAEAKAEAREALRVTDVELRAAEIGVRAGSGRKRVKR